MRITTTGTSYDGRARSSAAATALLTGLVLAASSCSADPGGERVPAATSEPAPTTSAPPPAAAPPAAQAVPTRVSVGVVAGRLGTRKRAEVKQAVAAVVDRYLDGAWAGTYPRTDFSAAFADFRAPARRDAERDLSLLTNVDVGAQVSAVTPTRRRLRVDLLSPRGRSSAATARFALDLQATGEVTRSVRVRGSLLLSNQRGAWKVFGYDVRPEVQP